MPVPLDGLAELSAWIRNQVVTLNFFNPERAAFRRFDSTLLEISSSEKLGTLIRGGHYPRGFIELFALLEWTGTKDLHRMNRESIRKLGSQKYSKES